MTNLLVYGYTGYKPSSKLSREEMAIMTKNLR
jgi:hypothetical protein